MKKKKTNKAKGHLKPNMIFASGATAATLLIAVPAFAASNTSPAYVLVQQRSINAAFGKVARINGSQITLSHYTSDGLSNVTVKTNQNTAYKTNGVLNDTADLAIGQRIVAMGVKDSVGNIVDATSVNVLVPRSRV